MDNYVKTAPAGYVKLELETFTSLKCLFHLILLTGNNPRDISNPGNKIYIRYVIIYVTVIGNHNNIVTSLIIVLIKHTPFYWLKATT